MTFSSRRDFSLVYPRCALLEHAHAGNTATDALVESGASRLSAPTSDPAEGSAASKVMVIRDCDAARACLAAGSNAMALLDTLQSCARPPCRARGEAVSNSSVQRALRSGKLTWRAKPAQVCQAEGCNERGKQFAVKARPRSQQAERGQRFQTRSSQPRTTKYGLITGIRLYHEADYEVSVSYGCAKTSRLFRRG